MLDDFVDSMTQADIERTCAEHLPRMLENLQLQRWRVRVFCKPLDGYNMWCSTLYNYLKATILIDPSKVESEEILLQKLQHELLHLVVAPIDPLYDAALRFAPCEASRKVAEDLYQYATERTIVNIEQMLTRCYSTTPPGGHMSKSKENQAPKSSSKRCRVRRTGTLEDALQRQWQGIVAAEEVLLIGLGSADHSTTLSAVHALTQANAAFVKMQETVSLQSQLDALREELKEIRQAQGLRKAV